MEEAVQERHHEPVAEAQAMKDGLLRMEVAGLLLQSEYPDELEINQVLMLAEQLEILHDELVSRGT